MHGEVHVASQAEHIRPVGADDVGSKAEARTAFGFEDERDECVDRRRRVLGLVEDLHSTCVECLAVEFGIVIMVVFDLDPVWHVNAAVVSECSQPIDHLDVPGICRLHDSVRCAAEGNQLAQQTALLQIAIC